MVFGPTCPLGPAEVLLGVDDVRPALVGLAESEALLPAHFLNKALIIQQRKLHDFINYLNERFQSIVTYRMRHISERRDKLLSLIIERPML